MNRLLRSKGYSHGLANNVYAGALSMAKNHRSIFFAAMPISVAGLYGPIFGRDQNPNGFVFFGGSLLCPCLAAVVLMIFPFRPYRSSPFGRGGPDFIDVRDPDMGKLAKIFTSTQATLFLWRSTLRFAFILLLLMALLAVPLRHSLEWSWDLPLQTVFLTLIASYLSLGSAVMDWGFRTYSATSVESPVSPIGQENSFQ